MEGQHQGVGGPVIVIVAAHRIDRSRWATIAAEAPVGVPKRLFGGGTGVR